MTFGLQLTAEHLTTTHNLAALPLLAELAVHGPPGFREKALDALLERRNPESLFQLVRQFHLLEPDQQQRLLHEGARLSNAIRRGYLDTDPITYQNACSLIVRAPDFEQVPLLVGSLMKDTPRKLDAARILHELAGKLAAENDVKTGPRISPTIRRHFLQTIRDGLRRFGEHRCDAVSESFLMVAADEVAEIRQFLQSATESCHNSMLRVLRRSDDPQVLRWIYAMLRTRQPPPAVLAIISDRDDKPFVEQLLDRTGIHIEPVVAGSLNHIKEVRWLKPEHPLLLSLPDPRQAAAVTFAMKTGVPLEDKLEIAAAVLDEGKTLARQATAQSLVELPGADANRLVQACLEDPDPEVQLAATLQLRKRGLPNALMLLLKKLDSSDDRIRAASQHALADYTMARYLNAFERMDDRTRAGVGRAILRIDPAAMPTLRADLQSSHRQNRTRCLRAIRALGVADEMTSELLVMLGDSDHMVRREAIESLLYVTRVSVVEALAKYAGGGHEISNGAATALETLHRGAKDPSVREAAIIAYRGMEQSPRR